MSLGYDLEPRVTNLKDTAELTATLYNSSTDQPYAFVDLAEVKFNIQLPDDTYVGPFVGQIQSDGTGYYAFQGTSQIGHYTVVATFTLNNGLVKSVRADIDVKDPFTEDNPTISPSYLVGTQIWAKVEDCFDADDEGPWLRDMTLNTFTKDKMESFIDMALFDINYLNPPTTLALTDFILVDPTTSDVSSTSNTPLIIQGGFIVVLRHLMTSYVEQPAPTGAQVAWQDRRDYLPRWAQVYQIEFTQYDRMAKLFKRQYLGLGTTKGLISSKAGRLLPAPMRTSNIGRGYW